MSSKRTRRPKAGRKVGHSRAGSAPREQQAGDDRERRAGDEEPDLLRDVASAAAEDDPMALLGLVSSLLAALDRRGSSPFEPDPEVPSREELVRSFLDVDLRETSLLLAVIAGLSGDAVLRRRVHREVIARGHLLPAWLADLHRAEPADRTVEVVHVLGDGDNNVIGVRLPGGPEFTAVVYVDHNMGTVVKDAFVVAEPVTELIDRMLDIAADPDTEARDIDPADARARITAAIETGAMAFPPFVTDTWPACRPLVEWAAALLPPGGAGYSRPHWAPDAVEALAGRFFASPFAAGLNDHDHPSLLDSLLWFGTEYGPGDPLRWSPTVVEILLSDWLPRKIVAEPSYLAKAPEVLRALIRYCHHERGIRADLTTETLNAVDHFEADYQRAIHSPRPQGPAALVAALGALGIETPWPPDEPPTDVGQMMLETLRRAVGGQPALDRLDDTPLPDDPFDWHAIPTDVRDRVTEVLTLVDRCCDTMLDTEYRTACRRFLARVAAGGPEIFRRRSQASTAAAAVCWTIGKANHLFDSDIGGRRVLVKDLLAHFGIHQGGLSRRAEPMLRALGVDPYQYGAIDLGSPDYLTSARRARIIALRDRYTAAADRF